MLKISLVIILGVLEVRSRIISQDKDKHQVKMTPVAKKSDTNNKLALFKLTLLDQIMNTQIK